jgi:ElaB/YqjD/DUF883 family membrane-anchored ribosome-binding protein
MTQETTQAFNRLDEWEELLDRYNNALAEWAAVANCGAPDPRRNAGGRLDDARRVLAEAAREAIPALIAMVRERERERDGLLRVVTDNHDAHCAAEAAEARATAAEARVKELERALRPFAEVADKIAEPDVVIFDGGPMRSNCLFGEDLFAARAALGGQS